MKRLFTILSLLAIVHVCGLAGVSVYAWSQDWLTKDRVSRAIAVLRGEEDGAIGPSEASASASAAAAPTSAGERIQRNVALEEKTRIELDRREKEIRDRAQFLDTQLLSHLREKEALGAAKERFALERRAQAEEAGDSGLKKELEILSGIKPKEAKELLRQKADADVVRILMSMELRKARKIASACKTNEERLWIGRILEQMHEQDPTQAEALDGGS